MPRVARVVDAAPAAESDENTCGSRAHQVQCRRVGGGATDDDGNIEFVDELLEVERFLVLRHVFSRDGRSADDEEVDACGNDGLVELLGALR